MMNLPDKFVVTVPDKAYGVKSATVTRRYDGNFSAQFVYMDDAHIPDQPWEYVEHHTVEGWLRTGEWVIQPDKKTDFTIVTGTGNQYDLVLREDGDYDMHGAGGQSWVRTAYDANRFIESGRWEVVEGTQPSQSMAGYTKPRSNAVESLWTPS